MPSKWLDLGIDWLNPPADNTVLVSAGMIELIKAAHDRRFFDSSSPPAIVYDPVLCNDVRYGIDRFKFYIEGGFFLFRDLGLNTEGQTLIDASGFEVVRRWPINANDGTFNIDNGWDNLEAYTGEDLSVFKNPNLVNYNTIVSADILRKGYKVVNAMTESIGGYDDTPNTYYNRCVAETNPRVLNDPLQAFNDANNNFFCNQIGTVENFLTSTMESSERNDFYKYTLIDLYELNYDFEPDPATGILTTGSIYMHNYRPSINSAWDDFGKGLTEGLVEKIPLVKVGNNLTLNITLPQTVFTYEAHPVDKGFVYGLGGNNIFINIDNESYLDYYTP